MSILGDLEISLPRSGGIALYPPGATFGPRSMREWEFVWMMQGDAIYRWADKVADAPERSVVLCRPGASDSFEWDVRRETRHAFFHFDVLRLPRTWTETGWPLVCPAIDDDLLIPLFRFVLTRLKRGDSDQVILAISSMLTAFRTGDRSTVLTDQRARSTIVTLTCDYIRRRLESDPAQAVTLEEMAAVAHVTPEHLCRLFQSAMGISPARVVRFARLDRAATLLAHSNYTISQIAEMCGFANPFHFSRRFKEVFGQSPSEVRVHICQGTISALPALLEQW